MQYYNEYRPHQTLKNKMPDAFENAYYIENENKKATNISWLFLDSPIKNLTLFIDFSNGGVNVIQS